MRGRQGGVRFFLLVCLFFSLFLFLFLSFLFLYFSYAAQNKSNRQCWSDSLFFKHDGGVGVVWGVACRLALQRALRWRGEVAMSRDFVAAK